MKEEINFLEKPFSPVLLGQKVREILKTSNRQIIGTFASSAGYVDRFYEQAQLSADTLQGNYSNEIGETFNVERTVQPKFSIFGNNLITHPAVDQDATILVSIWALFFPERFVYGDGSLKQTWQNSTTQCQMPSEFWPAMIEWTASRVRALSSPQDRALAMQDVLTSLNMGDSINERGEQERYPGGHR